MALKKIYFRGVDIEDVKKMGIAEFSKLVSSRARKSLKKGFTEDEKKLLARIERLRSDPKKRIKTQLRDMIIVPSMLDTIIHVHAGKEYVPVHITYEKLGHHLGEFSQTRRFMKHSAPGIGATKSTASASVK